MFLLIKKPNFLKKKKNTKIEPLMLTTLFFYIALINYS